ncbi:N-formylglutamate amidohydrolase [Roseibium alexandrii]
MGSNHQNGGMSRAVEVVNAEGAGELVLLCDHASNHFPPPYDQCLGVSDEEKSAHISWDPGALGVAMALSEALDAPLIYTTVSRLVIDCNREETREDLTPCLSELTEISGNRNLSDEERTFRINLVHRPFHDAIDKVLALRADKGRPSAVVSIHTYTPVYKGKSRPWEIGLISENDRRLADPVLTGLNARGDLTVGDNEPYAPSDGVYYTVRRHGEDKLLPCLMIEIRNDEVRTPNEELHWADILGPLLKSAAKTVLRKEVADHA